MYLWIPCSDFVKITNEEDISVNKKTKRSVYLINIIYIFSSVANVPLDPQSRLLVETTSKDEGHVS